MLLAPISIDNNINVEKQPFFLIFSNNLSGVFEFERVIK
jgi:hypothetical protein